MSLCFLTLFYSPDILSKLAGPSVLHSKNHIYFKIVSKFLTWLPWIAVAGVVIARIRKGPRVKAGFYVLGTLFPGICFAGFILLGSPIENYLNQEDFDAKVWRESGGKPEDFNWPPRLKMIDSLMEQKLLDGLTREEVIQLLGPPDSDNWAAATNPDKITYYLGPERGFISIDSEMLSINFDENDRVKEYRIWRD